MTADPTDLALIALAALWGALAGTLLPRAAHRFAVPSEEADTGWRTTCPAGHPLRGWLGRARCATCAATPPTTPYAPGARLHPLVTAAVCAPLAAATGTRPELGVWLVLAPVGVLLAAVDLRVRRLPDPLTLWLPVAALALLAAAALLPEHAGSWTTALLATLALGAAYCGLHLINPDGMAFGDVKLALGTGAVLGWYGWPTVMLGTLAGFTYGALYGGALVVAGRAGRRTTIPFGPFMLAGTLTGLLIGGCTA
ncbi:A24 family peptidase [Streptomyces antibioticus]|uniref:A24 family peptidase n=1 Tax=Streptomyces antibioticus TaxID=1890 RepID=UPI003401725C